MQTFLKKATHEWKVRAVFVNQQIDTTRFESKMLVAVFGVLDQFTARATVDLLNDGQVFGTETYGYTEDANVDSGHLPWQRFAAQSGT